MGHYSIKDLVEMQIPGFPRTRQGWHLRVQAEGWAFEESYGRGHGGVRRVYLPPPKMQDVIDRHLASQAGRQIRSTPEPCSIDAQPSSVSGKSGNEASGIASRSCDQSSKDRAPEGMDLALLEMVFHAVEIFQKQLGRELSFDEEAELVRLLYEKFFERRAEVTAPMMAKFLTAILPSGRAAA